MTKTEVQDYTETVETINGVDVKIYGGAKRPIETYALEGHVTGWLKRQGARVTYADPTCTCGRVGELWNPGEKGYVAYGEEGWIETLNRIAREHVENVTLRGFMVRPAGGDRSRHADRIRTDLAGLEAAGLTAREIEEIQGGGIVYGEDGTRYEVARDRSPYTRTPLPVR